METIRILIRERPEPKQTAAECFHSKWSVSTKAYLDCMNAYLVGETEYGCYLCLDNDKIIGGMGVIEKRLPRPKRLYAKRLHSLY